MEGYLISWFLYDIWIVYLFLYVRTHSFRFLSSKNVGFITFLILFLIIVFGEHSGDFRHYEEILDRFSASDVVASNFEPFYVWLTKVTGYNITIFRSIIGLGIIFAVYYSFKIYKELNVPAIFLFTLIPFYFLSNAIRQGVANSLCSLGLFYIFHNRNKFISIILIAASFYLHKSSILVVPALMFLWIPLKKKNIILLSLALFPLIILENILLIRLTDMLMGDGVIAVYMTSSSEENSTFLMRIMDLVFISVILILSYLSLKRVYKYKFNDVDGHRPLKLITRLLLGCLYMYIIYSGLQLDADYVSNRFAPFMYVPLVIVLMKAYGIKIVKNQLIMSLLFIYFIFMNLQIYRWFLVFF